MYMNTNDKIKNLENQNKNTEDFYERFHKQLDEKHKFPGNYMFKFIIPTEGKKIALLHKIFDHGSPSFMMKESKNGKYTSATVTLYVPDATAVIEYYKEASKIEGIMMM